MDVHLMLLKGVMLMDVHLMLLRGDMLMESNRVIDVTMVTMH